MRIMVFGSNGFIGHNVASVLSQKHDVIRASRGDEGDLAVDLLNMQTIELALRKASPDAIINCAGIIKNDESAKANVEFSRNILKAVINTGTKVSHMIISSSAAVYGSVDSLPVYEDVPLNGTSEYAKSKIEEESTAMQFAQSNNLPLTVVRIFNPIGPGMNQRQLLPNIIKMINESTGEVTVSRRDSIRDYIDVRDVAEALRALIENNPRWPIYNVGSGVSTSNERLVELVALCSGVIPPRIIETQKEPESMVASQAGIARLTEEFKWRPMYAIKDTIEELTNGQ